MGNGYHHFLFGDHIFNREILGIRNNLCPAFIAISFLDLPQLGLDDLHAQTTVIEDLVQPGD